MRDEAARGVVVGARDGLETCFLVCSKPVWCGNVGIDAVVQYDTSSAWRYCRTAEGMMGTSQQLSSEEVIRVMKTLLWRKHVCKTRGEHVPWHIRKVLGPFSARVKCRRYTWQSALPCICRVLVSGPERRNKGTGEGSGVGGRIPSLV